MSKFKVSKNRLKKTVALFLLALPYLVGIGYLVKEFGLLITLKMIGIFLLVGGMGALGFYLLKDSN